MPKLCAIRRSASANVSVVTMCHSLGICLNSSRSGGGHVSISAPRSWMADATISAPVSGSVGLPLNASRSTFSSTAVPSPGDGTHAAAQRFRRPVAGRASHTVPQAHTAARLHRATYETVPLSAVSGL